MERCPPSERGHRPTETLSPRGRATRARCASGELWRLPAADRALAARLLELAEHGLGGFVDGGEDDEGVWLVRRLPVATLGAERRRDAAPWPWRRAVGVALGIARALARAESASLFPGPVTPTLVRIDDARAVVPADALVLALVGHDAAIRRPASDTQPKALLWRPPEAVDQAAWDNASNRYALGAMLYEMIAGAHPFGGAGLRHALAEAQGHEAAPFTAEVARSLPAGLQSLVLKLVAKEPERRPASAQQIVERLEEVVGERVAVVRPSERHAVAAPSATGSKRVAPRRRAVQTLDLRWLAERLGRGPLRYAPVLLGVVVCGLAVARALDAPPKIPARDVDVGAARSVDGAHTRAEDCAGCHPQHAAEWSQSVMGHAVKSPLFNALEALIEEQVGRDRDCPGGAGILRRSPGPGLACRDAGSGLDVTGSGGEHWCVNCHSPGDNIATQMPAWQGRVGGDPRTRHPVRDLVSDLAMEGISCAFCHQVHGPVGPNGSFGYQGNPTWTSFVTGAVFLSRPEDRRGVNGIANSGYRLDAAELLDLAAPAERLAITPGGFVAHARPTDSARAYLRSSEFCGSCHDVRLFGTDVVGAGRGESFKRLRNAYSEWVDFADRERGRGRSPASCQDCHMSTYPGVCVIGERDGDLAHESCPEGMRFEPHEPGRRPSGHFATGSPASSTSPHYFTSVDLPLAQDIADAALDQRGVDRHGIPLSAKKRRDLLIRRSLRLDVGEASRAAGELSIPLEIENVGGGHKIPAGFSQEREIWVHLRVEDGSGAVLYEVGRVERNDEDLRDKVFLRVNTDPDQLDGEGRPVGLFGADVRDGPDAPEWSPPPELGGQSFRGKGLINFQNGFLRCVRCIGTVSAAGECEPLAFEQHRAQRYDDGDYDLDTGECRSNLLGDEALFETYFPVGALDASRGFVKGPDAIIDTRSLPPGAPKRYTYVLPTFGRAGPFRVVARLMFRGFPPFLVRAFAEYEAKQAARGRRPSGPLVSFDMLARLERVEVARETLVVP